MPRFGTGRSITYWTNYIWEFSTDNELAYIQDRICQLIGANFESYIEDLEQDYQDALIGNIRAWLELFRRKYKLYFTCKLLLTTPLVHLFVMRSHCPLQSKKSQSLWFWHVTFSVMVLSGTESWCGNLINNRFLRESTVGQIRQKLATLRSFLAIFCQLSILHPSQNWVSNGHFEVLNEFKS